MNRRHFLKLIPAMFVMPKPSDVGGVPLQLIKMDDNYFRAHNKMLFGKLTSGNMLAAMRPLYDQESQRIVTGMHSITYRHRNSVLGGYEPIFRHLG